MSHSDLCSANIIKVHTHRGLNLLYIEQKSSKLSSLEDTGFDICFRVCQSADHLWFCLQNGDFTCYELRKPLVRKVQQKNSVSPYFGRKRSLKSPYFLKIQVLFWSFIWIKSYNDTAIPKIQNNIKVHEYIYFLTK